MSLMAAGAGCVEEDEADAWGGRGMVRAAGGVRNACVKVLPRGGRCFEGVGRVSAA